MNRRKRAKGGPLSEATVRTRRGIASHTGPSAGTRPDRDRNSSGPSAGARGTADPCSRQRQRQARASHATRTRPSRPSREHKPRFFILGATSFLLFMPLPLLLLPAISFSSFRLFLLRLGYYRDGGGWPALARSLDDLRFLSFFPFFPFFLSIFFSFLPFSLVFLTPSSFVQRERARLGVAPLRVLARCQFLERDPAR